MMPSYIQLLCIFVSLIFGGLFKISYDFCSKLLVSKNIFLKLVSIFFIVILFALLYLFVVYKINGGIIDIYFYLLIIFGYILVSVKKRKI